MLEVAGGTALGQVLDIEIAEVAVAAPDFGLGHALAAGPNAPAPLVVRLGGRVSREGGDDVSRDCAAP